MANPQTYSLEETLALIAEKANALKGAGQPPLFELNLSRRNSSGMPQQLASFTQVTLEHIQDPVRWLPMLCGGGEYMLNVRHPDTSGRIGGVIGVNFDKSAPGMEPRAIDSRVTRSPAWVGPQLNGGAFNEPAQAPAGATAMPWMSGAQVTSGYGTIPTVQQPVDREREMAAQLADLKAQNARIEAESKARAELEAERRNTDTRVREERDRADRQLRESEERTRTQIAALQASTPKTDPEAGWQKLIAIVMPIVQQMMTSQHEMRMLTLKMNEDANRRQIEASEKQHQAQMEMIRAITAKPAGMSDEMKLLIETLRAKQNEGGDSAIAAMATRLFEGMAVMQKMSIGMIETVADMQMGDSEHPAVGAVREFASAMKIMMSGAKEGAQRVIPKKTLSAGTRLTPEQLAKLNPQQLAALQQQQRQRQAQAQAQQAAAAAAGRQVPPKPTATQRAPGPVPVTTFTPPVAPPPPPAEPQPELMQAPDGTFKTHFDVLRDGILGLKPPTEVVDYFVGLKKADELSLKRELDKHGGSPWAMIQAEFGMPFVAQNQSYFEELGETIDARGVEEGWWAPMTDEEAAEGDEGDEGAGDVGIVPEAAISLEAAPVLEAPPAAPETSAVVVVPTVPPTKLS